MYTKTLSKSKLLAHRQCPRRLWLELHRPELREDSAGAEARFLAGEQVAAVARELYDPRGEGTLVDTRTLGVAQAVEATQALLSQGKPIFEAGFAADGALAFADVLLPDEGGGWHMVEVKSSGSVKDYQRDDVAIQSLAARAAGVPLRTVRVAHIDTSWTYPGHGDYRGLLQEADLTDEVAGREPEVRAWVAGAHDVARRDSEPDVPTGPQCSDPFECPFTAHCAAGEPQPEYPSAWLPGVRKKDLKQALSDGALDMRDVPDALLNEPQRRVKQQTLSGEPWLARDEAAAALAEHALPAYFMDFETVMFAVPIWPGTRPYQQIPFQFSVHRLAETGSLEHRPFLDVSGQDPSRLFAEALLAAVETAGPVFVYNVAFERGRLRELAERFPDLGADLEALDARLVDLMPLVRRCYYHPSQQGSWSLKAVVPAVAPDLDYANLDGVQDGGMAAEAYIEAIDAETSAERRAEIERELSVYCRIDTEALVRIWALLSDVPAV